MNRCRNGFGPFNNLLTNENDSRYFSDIDEEQNQCSISVYNRKYVLCGSLNYSIFKLRYEVPILYFNVSPSATYRCKFYRLRRYEEESVYNINGEKNERKNQYFNCILHFSLGIFQLAKC